MISRVPVAVRAAAYRSPPIRASAAAARYTEATSSRPRRSGSGRRTTCCAVSATVRSWTSSLSWTSRRCAKKVTNTEIMTSAMIWTVWFRSAMSVRAPATTTCASTATSPTKPVIRGPANEAVTAGAAARNGPRCTSGGERTSATVTRAISANGTSSCQRLTRRDRWRRVSDARSSIPPAYTARGPAPEAG
ncbi:hypothetical protein SF23_19970, partial [Streptomyces sp. MBRL 10]